MTVAAGGPSDGGYCGRSNDDAVMTAGASTTYNGPSSCTQQDEGEGADSKTTSASSSSSYVHHIDETESERLLAQAMAHPVLAETAHDDLKAYLEKRKTMMQQQQQQQQQDCSSTTTTIRVLIPYFGSGANARVIWKLATDLEMLDCITVTGVELRSGDYRYDALQASVPGLDVTVVSGNVTDAEWMQTTFGHNDDGTTRKQRPPFDVVYTTYGLEHTPSHAVTVLNTLHGLLRQDGGGLLHIAECTWNTATMRSFGDDGVATDAEFQRLVTCLQTKQRAAGGNPNYGDTQMEIDVRKSVVSSNKWKITPLPITWETGTAEPFQNGLAFVIALFKSVGLDPALLEQQLSAGKPLQGFLQVHVYVLVAET